MSMLDHGGPEKLVSRKAHRSFPLYVHLSVLFSLLILAMGGAIAWMGYVQGRELTLSAADAVFEHITRETDSNLRQTFEPVARFGDVLALHPLVDARNLDGRLRALPMLHRVLDNNGSAVAVYVGYDDGDFFLLRRLRDEAVRAIFAAPAQARYVVQSIERRGAAPLYIFFDEAMHELGRRTAPEYDYDPRTRPWYKLARTPGERVFTEPYVFFSTGTPGVTLAQRTSARSVIGIDITLAHLSSELAGFNALPGMRLVLFDEHQRVLAGSDMAAARPQDNISRVALNTLHESGDPLLTAMPSVTRDGRRSLDLRVDGRAWKSAVRPIDTASGRLFLAVAVPLDELLQNLRATRTRHALVSLALLLCAVPLTALTAQGVARRMRRITDQAREIRAFRFDGHPAGRSIILEVDELSQAMQTMRDTIGNFLDISISLAGETDFDRLLEHVVRETCKATDAIGGLIYLSDAEQGGLLRPTPPIDRDGARLPANLHAITPTGDSVIATAFRDITTRKLALSAQRTPELWPLQRQWPAQRLGVVAIPLRDRSGERVGVIALFAPEAELPEGARLAFAETLSGTAAVAIETHRLMESRKAMLNAFMRLVAGAIDAKSPYTGAHCQRVPELTLLLARAACDTQTGPYKNFQLDAQQWEALQIASWLHDCGKVTTPEYVVDKATKLETIYDRLHEIRMRFEVLKRDVRIDTLQRIAAGGDAARLEAECAAQQAELDAEFTFVASCNQGGESMHPDSIARLERIGRRTWLRTLDDRIGLSADETRRKAREPMRSLPAVERLLANKSEHLVERPDAEHMPVDNEWGFKLDAPTYKYNRGELHNLRIERGTLTEEERYIINHHIVQTIIMLSRLPFPKHLRDVPEIAGGHHEKMDGTGYPKGLTREEMSATARMMAIADIFEALTASDRPYKKAKKLSESLSIMHRMKQDRHIDPELYELFIDTGVWRAYAERFLQPWQIDVADATPYR